MNSECVPTWWLWIFGCPSKFAQVGEGEWGSIILGERGVHYDLGEGWWKLEAWRKVRLDLEERKQEIVLWIVNIHHELGCPKGKSLKLPQSAYLS